MKTIISTKRGLTIAGRDIFSVFESWYVTIGASLACAVASVIGFLRDEGVMIANVAALMSMLIFLLRSIYMILEIREKYSSADIERRMRELDEATEEDNGEWEKHHMLVRRLETLIEENKAARDKSEK